MQSSSPLGVQLLLPGCLASPQLNALALELVEQEQFSHCFEGCLVWAIYEVPGSSRCQAVGSE